MLYADRLASVPVSRAGARRDSGQDNRSDLCNPNGETQPLLPSIRITSYNVCYTKLLRDVWRELQADAGCDYDEHAEIDLTKIEPLIACPSSPGNIKTVREVAGTKADQVIRNNFV